MDLFWFMKKCWSKEQFEDCLDDRKKMTESDPKMPSTLSVKN